MGERNYEIWKFPKYVFETKRFSAKDQIEEFYSKTVQEVILEHINNLNYNWPSKIKMCL